MSNYLDTPNRHVLVHLRGLYQQGQLTVNDQRLMELYEQLVKGKRRKDGARIVRAVGTLLTRKGVTEAQISAAAQAQKKRLGKPAKSPPKVVQQPTEARKKMLAVLQTGYSLLQPNEQQMVDQYIAALGGQHKMDAQQFHALEQSIGAVYKTVAKEVQEDAQEVAGALQDNHLASNTRAQIEELERGVALLANEDDIAYVQGLVMQEQMGLLDLSPAVKQRVDQLYKRVIHRSDLSPE
ncbi:MAG: hypothetical protein GY772_29505 [bacterium]|nr:hypothetical protein [bacterium]